MAKQKKKCRGTCCIAWNCANRQGKRSAVDSADRSVDITFHRFPTNFELRDEWSAAIRRKDFKPSSGSRICSEHFKPTDFTTNSHKRRRLKQDAIPSIFNFPPHLEQPKTKYPRVKKLMEESPGDKLTPSDKSLRKSNNSACDKFPSKSNGSCDQSPSKSNGSCDQSPSKSNGSCDKSVSNTSNDSCDKSLSNTTSNSNSSCDKSQSDSNRLGHDHSYFCTPEKEASLKRRVLVLQKQLIMTRARLRRTTNCNKRLKDVIKSLRDRRFIEAEVEATLQKSFSGMSLDLFRHVRFNAKEKRPYYLPKVKTFALSILSLSPEAYELIRPILCLPRPRHVLRWKYLGHGSPESMDVTPVQ